MVNRDHRSDYDGPATERCERALVTLIGDIGPWSDRIALVGGLAPRYLVDSIPADVPAHVGTADVDLVLGLSLGDADAEAYRTLHNNLLGSGFTQAEPSFRWTRMVDGVTVAVEFLGETSDVQPGRVFRPRGGSGSRLAALNVTGSSLAIQDNAPVQITAARLDDGGESTVTIHVAGILSFVVLKILAFQDRHQNKDAYDLVYSMLYFEGGPEGAAGAASA
ncbi:MAG: antitoxin, partial [Actinomycetota bacterium]|nr:antitoxin [Actinomycetota bacterium]